ncbi:MAG: Ig-like domain repeat protein [Acidimicrobiales bacterium]
MRRRRGRDRLGFGQRPVLSALVLTIGFLGALGSFDAPPAGAAASTWYAYPSGTSMSSSSCPQTSTSADQCSLTQALADATAGDTVALAVSGTNGTTSSYYVGNFSISTAGTSASSPITVAPAAGVNDPIIDGDDNPGFETCPTTTCDGPVLTVPSGTYVDISGVTIQNGYNTSSGEGGGIDSTGDLTVADSTFSGNSAESDGGAIASGDRSGSGTLTVTGSTFSGNSAAADGGAIDSGDHSQNGTLTVSDSTFSGNSDGDDGGAIDSGDNFGNGTLTISDSTFSDNGAESGGGAIDSADNVGIGTATVSDSAFSDNSSSDEFGGGGAIDSGADSAQGDLTVSDSTFSQNTSAEDGGAIGNGDEYGSGTLTVSDSTFSQNTSAEDGGAIASGGRFGAGSLSVTSSTFSGNGAAASGGTIDDGAGTATLAADIVANATSGGNCAGTITDSGYNVDSDGTCGFLSAHDSVSGSTAIDAYLGNLSNHGGPTETVPLMASPTSPVGPDPALDAIPSSFDLPDSTNACSTPDQRGIPRVAPCDIGAYETHPTDVGTTTELVGSAHTVALGASVTYTATVVPTTDDGVGSSVTFSEASDGGSPVTAHCADYSFDGRHATCTLTYSTPGSYTVDAAYGGDSVFAPSGASSPWALRVGSTPTTTTLRASDTTPSVGETVTYTAAVSPAPRAGSVAFSDNGTHVSCGPGSRRLSSGTATCEITYDSAGSHTLLATYSGTPDDSGSISVPVVVAVSVPNPWERVAAADGGVFSFRAPFHGSMNGKALNAPVVGMATDPATGGYWLVASDGGVFSFDAPFHGSMGGRTLNAKVVGMAATPGGGGYWLVAADGGIFSFGDAPFFGSMGGTALDASVVGMATDPATGGYWLVASDGGVFSFHAPFHGSMDGKALNAPVVGMATDPATGGYWLLAANGNTAAFDARDGSFVKLASPNRAVSIVAGW